MEQEIKEKLISWIYGYSSYKEFIIKNCYELDRELIENTLQELAGKLTYGLKTIWDICTVDIIILKTFLNIGDPERTITTTGTAFKLNISQPTVYNSLCRTKKQILQEINKRRIMEMSKEEILAVPIENFNLSSRTAAALLKNGIFTVNELTRITIKKLKTLEGMGPKTVKEIIDVTHSFGMAFQGETIKTEEESIRKQLETKMQKRYNIEQEISLLEERKKEVDKEIEALLSIVEKENERRYTKKYR